MSEYLIKAVLAVAALALAGVSFFTMMAVLGKPPDQNRRVARLRRTHKVTGWMFVAVVAALTAMGGEIIAERGDGLPTRGVFHVVLAVTLLALLVQKILVVRVYRQFLKQAQGLGIAVFSLTLIIVLITAGFYLLRLGAIQ